MFKTAATWKINKSCRHYKTFSEFLSGVYSTSALLLQSTETTGLKGVLIPFELGKRKELISFFDKSLFAAHVREIDDKCHL